MNLCKFLILNTHPGTGGSVNRSVHLAKVNPRWDEEENPRRGYLGIKIHCGSFDSPESRWPFIGQPSGISAAIKEILQRGRKDARGWRNETTAFSADFRDCFEVASQRMAKKRTRRGEWKERARQNRFHLAGGNKNNALRVLRAI